MGNGKTTPRLRPKPPGRSQVPTADLVNASKPPKAGRRPLPAVSGPDHLRNQIRNTQCLSFHLHQTGRNKEAGNIQSWQHWGKGLSRPLPDLSGKPVGIREQFSSCSPQPSHSKAETSTARSSSTTVRGQVQGCLQEKVDSRSSQNGPQQEAG